MTILPISRICFSGNSETRWNAYVARVEGLMGTSLSDNSLEQACEAFLEGESAVEFALSIQDRSAA
ncbi:hypothetical protein ACRQ5Q_22555 [Bradyrhizobium sp. PMVTL-01]|uniref:hypothetical protein n=1 Tax=Bradyrhizobium sp. PMVTL-01 TaxID=3434999 RepID=UPI003F7023AC